jgi:hypothetical protein
LQLKSAKGLEILLDWVGRLGTKNCYKVQQSQHNTQKSAFTGAFLSFSIVHFSRIDTNGLSSAQLKYKFAKEKKSSSQIYFPCKRKFRTKSSVEFCVANVTYISCSDWKKSKFSCQNWFFFLASPHIHMHATPTQLSPHLHPHSRSGMKRRQGRCVESTIGGQDTLYIDGLCAKI